MIDRERPLFDDTEKPVGVTQLHEACEGQQVSGTYYLTGPPDLPPGWCALVVEFTTSDVLVIMAAPVLEPAFLARLVFRWIPREHIWTRSMRERYSMGHGRAVPNDFLKRNVQGEVIRGIHGKPTPTASGGDDITLEFASGHRLKIEAGPHDERPMCATLLMTWEPKAPRVVVG